MNNQIDYIVSKREIFFLLIVMIYIILNLWTKLTLYNCIRNLKREIKIFTCEINFTKSFLYYNV